MDTEIIEGWLRLKQTKKSLACCGLGLALLLISVPVLIITFFGICAAYTMAVMSLNSSFGILQGAIEYTQTASFVILLLCFPCYALANRERLADLSVSTGTSHDKVVHVHVGGMAGSTVNPMAPDTAASFIKVITSVLFVGPALSLNGLNQFAKAVRVRFLKFRDAACIIDFLFTRSHRVTFGELGKKYPHIDLTRTARDLAQIDGVLVLSSPPPGLSLSDRLRVELRQVDAKNKD